MLPYDLNVLIGGPEWLGPVIEHAIIGSFAVICALVAHALLFRFMRRLSKSSDSRADDILLTQLAQPTRWAFVALAIVLTARELPVFADAYERLAGFIMPGLIGWIVLAIVRALFKVMALRADITVEDNLNARRKRTRLAIFSRLVSFLIVFVTVGMIMLSIPGVRDVGVTLVASAGLAGLAVGAAAQPALKSLIAGLQMALTEPINIDDVVIMEGEWGWIEEIRTTYVIIKVWDERRLIVPTSKFLDDSFQNWTKQTAQLLGSVTLYLDPATKLGPIREEFAQQVKANARWDGRVQVTQLVETSPEAIEVRLLMSAKDSPTLFDLRCDIREGMMDWIGDNMAKAIVRRRIYAEIDRAQLHE